MADLFDRFTGSAGAITSHTADSGDTWGPSGTSGEIDGSGSAYYPAPISGADFMALSSWTPPGTDYAVSIVFGSGFRQSVPLDRHQHRGHQRRPRLVVELRTVEGVDRPQAVETERTLVSGRRPPAPAPGRR